MVMVQEACVASVAVQVVVKGKSAMSVPSIVSPVSDESMPVFVSVTVCPAPGDPTTVTLKLNWGIDRPMPGGMAEAETATTPRLRAELLGVESLPVATGFVAAELPKGASVPATVMVPVIAPSITGVTVI